MTDLENKTIILNETDLPVVLYSSNSQIVGMLPYYNKNIPVKIIINDKIQNHKTFLNKIELYEYEFINIKNDKVFFSIDTKKIRTKFKNKMNFLPDNLKLSWQNKIFSKVDIKKIIEKFKLKTESNNLLLVDESLYQLIVKHFDFNYYNKQTGNSFRNIREAIEHFHIKGWKKGFNPNNFFSTKEYLKIYKDVKKSNVNPFEHYLRQGKIENRFMSFKETRKLMELGYW